MKGAARRHVRNARRLAGWYIIINVLVVAALTYQAGWAAGLGGGIAAAILVVTDRRHIADDAFCAKCSHRKDDHHGNCQECLREKARGMASSAVPCSRFGR